MTKFTLLCKKEVQSISNRIDFDKFARKRVVITGGSGLVGGYLVNALLKCTDYLGGDAPEVIGISKVGVFPNLQSLVNEPKLSLMKMDLENEDIDFDFEVLIHAASAASPTIKISRETMFETNCRLLRNLHDNPSDVEKVLFISTGEVYGADAPRNVKEDFIGKLDTGSYRANYPEAKLAGEYLTSSLKEVGVSGRVARLFHSFGPGLRIDDGRSFADFLWSAAFGQPPILRSSGLQVRSFLYLEDSVVGLLKVLDSDTETPINVGSDIDFTISEFASRVSMIAGLGGEVEHQLNESGTVYSPNNVVVPSNGLLRKFGWNQTVDLDESIERTINWIRNNH
jgi:dTDP-glucose 4,6-dehydratase